MHTVEKEHINQTKLELALTKISRSMTLENLVRVIIMDPRHFQRASRNPHHFLVDP
jgi:hypothetical protein